MVINNIKLSLCSLDKYIREQWISTKLKHFIMYKIEYIIKKEMNQNNLKEELLYKLPKDVIFYIMEYDGRYTIRSGKPIMKISPEDERYELLKRIPKIIKNTIFQYDSYYGCKTIVWFSCGSQLMYCNKRTNNHLLVFRMRKKRANRNDNKWKIPEITEII